MVFSEWLILRTSEAILHTIFVCFLIHSPYIYESKMRTLFVSPYKSTLQISTLVQELTTFWHWRFAFDFHLHNAVFTLAAYLYFWIIALDYFFHLPLIPLSLSSSNIQYIVYKPFTYKLRGL
jgi:hypothetical protein